MYVRKQFDEAYDIVVVGAGPAGSMAAWQAARDGARVLLLEKDPVVGTPVRCAEGVARKALEEFFDFPLPSHWIATEVVHFRLFAPDGTSVQVNIAETGLILHRRLFDYDLAQLAVQAGAQLLTNAYVFDVLKSENRVTGVRVRVHGTEFNVAARVVIAADGVESRVARWAGIDSTIAIKDIETCVQYTLSDIDIDADTCDFFFSNDFAPGGYAWAFPKGERTANVGLGVSAKFTRNRTPEDYFFQFLERYFPRASVSAQTLGGVPADRTLKTIVADGFMIVGDAAHQANPISGGGIVSGMVAGKIAGEVAARAVKTGKTDRKALLPYAREWHRKIGKTHQRYYRLKEALLKFDDPTFNRLAADYQALRPDQQTLLNLFKMAFKHNPAFIWDVIRIFAAQ